MLLVSLGWRSPCAAATREQRTDFQLALLKYDGQWNPRPNGLPRLAWEIRKRTSIAVELEVAAVSADETRLFDHPLLVWQGEGAFAPLQDEARNRLRRHLTRGGTLLVDVSEGTTEGGFYRAVRRELRAILPERKVVRIPTDHVLYKSFYLLDRHGGRVATQPYLEGVFVHGRLAVVLSANDLAGAMARDQFGQWQYDVGPGGEATREVTFRLGVNLVMYALCLDYKEDQVHIPFILRRRR